MKRTLFFFLLLSMAAFAQGQRLMDASRKTVGYIEDGRVMNDARRTIGYIDGERVMDGSRRKHPSNTILST